MHDHPPTSTRLLYTAHSRALPNAPSGGYPPLDLDADCPWRTWQSARRKSPAVNVGTWFLLGLLAFLVGRVLMSR